MTIDEAIKTLQSELNHGFRCGYEELDKAQQLGIEALAFIKQHRSVLHTIYTTLLPGETKD